MSMLPSDSQSISSSYPIHILMVAFEQDSIPLFLRPVISSLDSEPSIEWAATPQKSQTEPSSGIQYDVLICDCRKDLKAWLQLNQVVPGGEHGIPFGIMNVSEDKSEAGKILEDDKGYRVDETMAPMALKWVLQRAQERKQFLVEQERLRNQLGEAAYKIEMADVASTVLHNVGNVLTSVTVAAHMVESVVDQSPVTLVNRMAELINTHQESLGTYLTEDPKGKRIPTSLEKLGTHLVDEQQKVLNEMKGLVRNIRHMKQIIASHQTMAKSAGHAEQIALADVLSHAMELSFQPGDSTWITIHREYQEVPPVLVDQHQLLQILVNLLRNAKQAMRQQSQDSHELRLRVDYQDKDKSSVVMTIQDSGIGIAPEHLSKMFTRGFTTKKDGNGIGLHSSIAAIQDMGGSMHVHSDGVGLGAMFTLTFPVQKEVVLA